MAPHPVTDPGAEQPIYDPQFSAGTAGKMIPNSPADVPEEAETTTTGPHRLPRFPAAAADAAPAESSAPAESAQEYFHPGGEAYKQALDERNGRRKVKFRSR